MTSRQHAVNFPADGIDVELAAFIADVQELAGLFRRVADDIARGEGQTQARWYALSVVSDEPLTVSQAARRLGTTRQAVQRVVNELANDGLVVTELNPDHRTSPLIALSPEGRRVLARISRAAGTARRRWFADSDAARLPSARGEVQTLLDALRGAVAGA